MPSKQPGESRQLVIGRIDDQSWTIIITTRIQAVRLIGARRSRANEKSI